MKRVCLLLTAVLLISSVVIVTSASANGGPDLSAKSVSVSGISVNNHGAGH
jgi:hypothetical protein